MRPTALTLLRKSRAALWAALVSLALYQAAIAGHTTQHAVDEVGESCELCLKVEETQASLVDSGTASELPRPAAIVETSSPVAASRTSARWAHIRAPPLA